MGKASAKSRSRRRGARKATPADDEVTPAADGGEEAAATEEWGRRPRTVLVGAVLVYVGAGLVALFGVLVVIGSTDPSFLRSVESSAGLADIPTAVFNQFVRDLSIVVAVFGAIGIVVAALAQRGRRRARIVLTVLAVLYVLPLLMAAVDGSLPALAMAAYVVAAAVLFWVRGANRWYQSEWDRRRSK
ncbi:MAG: hypothetical protein GEV07_05135 [Streptosporangiales bacterium]|nr:hypothetical protein [Streptosporangiales bacterium]